MHDEGHQLQISEWFRSRADLHVWAWRSHWVKLHSWFEGMFGGLITDLQSPIDFTPNKPFCLIRAYFWTMNASQWFHLFSLQDLNTKVIIALLNGLLSKQEKLSFIVGSLGHLCLAFIGFMFPVLYNHFKNPGLKPWSLCRIDGLAYLTDLQNDLFSVLEKGKTNPIINVNRTWVHVM